MFSRLDTHTLTPLTTSAADDARVIAVTVVGGFVAMARILGKDEAIDAAAFLALRELRERLERGELPRR